MLENFSCENSRPQIQNWALKITHFGGIWGKIALLSIHNLLHPKFAAVCRKIATSYAKRFCFSQVVQKQTLGEVGT